MIPRISRIRRIVISRKKEKYFRAYRDLSHLIDEKIELQEEKIDKCKDRFESLKEFHQIFLDARKKVKNGQKYAIYFSDCRKNKVAKYAAKIAKTRIAEFQLDKIKERIKYFRKNIDFVFDIDLDKTTLEQEQIDEVLSELFQGEIKRSRALKKIFNKPQEEPCVATKVKDLETAIQEVKPVITTPYVKRTYSRAEMNFLTYRGINISKAKELLDYNDFPIIKQFMLSIEDAFKEAGKKAREAFPIYKVRPSSLILENSDLTRYLVALEDLFLAYPNSSGILPRYAPHSYKSAADIRALIRKEEPNVTIIGLEDEDGIITNEKDRANLEEQLKQAPYNTGRHLKTIKNQPGPLYLACIDERRHKGHFRRVEFGPRRVLFEVFSTGDNTHTVEVFKYFETHAKYEQFFKPYKF